MAWPSGSCRPRRGRERRLRQRAPGGQVELLADDVEAADELGHAVLDLEPRVDLEEPERAVRSAEELGGRGVAQTGRGRDPDRQLVEVATGRRSSGRAPAPPRRASGGAAGSSSPAPRGPRPGRSRRRGAGPRCGAPAGPRARGRPSRRRTPTAASADPAASAAGRSAARTTRRIPRPPPPAAALTSSGKPIASASASDRRDGIRSVDRHRIDASRAPRRRRSTGRCGAHAACRRAPRSPRTAARRRRDPASSTARANAARSDRNP